MEIPYGYCKCGCGQRSNIIQVDDKKRDRIKGEPFQFVRGHNTPRRDKNPNWNGGTSTQGHYKIILVNKAHPRSNNHGYVLEHLLIIEKALRRPLKKPEETHHVNINKIDNSSGNLVVCQDRSYHWLLHRRMRAIKACGHASWLKCYVCKQYDNPENMHVTPDKKQGYHRQCHNFYHKQYRINNGGI